MAESGRTYDFIMKFDTLNLKSKTFRQFYLDMAECCIGSVHPWCQDSRFPRELFLRTCEFSTEFLHHN